LWMGGFGAAYPQPGRGPAAVTSITHQWMFSKQHGSKTNKLSENSWRKIEAQRPNSGRVKKR
jgi:hypothetical protein